MVLDYLYHILLPAEFILAVLVFILLFYINAPYGRFLKKGWGPVLPARLAWIIQELPAFLVILLCFIGFEGWHNPVSWLFLLVWEMHYFHRTFIYPFRMSSGKKHYPALLVLFAIIFNTMNGFINGYFLFHLAQRQSEWLREPQLYAGLMVFLVGFFINKQSDRILRKLRSKSKGEYVIPRGGFFRFVSSPHYFGEIVEWSGWAILTWSMPGLAFAVFTFANLAPRALAHHRWYKSHFENYPGKRKALVPYTW